jgi:hypothetical protein
MSDDNNKVALPENRIPVISVNCPYCGRIKETLITNLPINKRSRKIQCSNGDCRKRFALTEGQWMIVDNLLEKMEAGGEK